MTRKLQILRGTTAQNNAYTGAVGELTMDTDRNEVRIHDGQTPGGTPMARADTVTDMTGADYVVESQLPTADNGYTWYRLYKSGWLEAGGRLSGRAITFPRAFAVPPTVSISSSDPATICAVTINIYDITTTGFSGHRAQIADTWHTWVMDMAGYWLAAGVSVNTPDAPNIPPQQ